MHLRLIALPALVVSAAVLAGCGGAPVSGGVAEVATSASEGASYSSIGGAREIEVAPASGPTINGDGYSYRAPEGWSMVDVADVQGSKPDSIAQSDSPSVTVCQVMNVNLRPEGNLSLTQAEELLVTELTDDGSADVALGDRVLVAGGESPNATFTSEMSGVVYAFARYFVRSEGQTFMFTFNCGDSPVAERRALAESVLATWTWTD